MFVLLYVCGGFCLFFVVFCWFFFLFFFFFFFFFFLHNVPATCECISGTELLKTIVRAATLR